MSEFLVLNFFPFLTSISLRALWLYISPLNIIDEDAKPYQEPKTKANKKKAAKLKKIVKAEKKKIKTTKNPVAKAKAEQKVIEAEAELS